ncbi:MAG: hypothetical protein QOJ99_4569 [Bryobacterales bacterium]|nr:hypothetical protein [Bryobacterales bacterium]
MTYTLKKSGMLAVCLCLITLQLFSQAGVASLSGMVADPSQAIVPGAKITATNQATGISRSTTTDEAGFYAFSSLPVGPYEISAEGTGFNTSRQRMMLDPSAKARADFQLAMAGASTTVAVQDAPPMVARDDASIGTVIENQTITSTPLFARNWDDLIRLAPGVQAQRYTEQSGGSASGRTGSFNIHGIDSLQNNFILDGIDNNTFSENVQELSTQAARPSVDVIAEFKLISSPYTAAYGRSPGAVVDVTTKGGSNDPHALLFEYLRNRVFDANDFFSNRSGLPKPANVQNQFGGNVGAPVVKNKLFGFFNYEGTRIRRGITRLSTVPLPNERNGDFSPAAAAANGISYPTIKDPITGQPYPNNIIPGGQIDPYGKKLMNLFPLPNQSGNVNNFARTGALIDDMDSYDARVDWSASAKDLVFGRYTSSNRTRDIPGYYGGIADGTSTSSWGNSTLKSYSAVIGWTHVFGPRLVNDFRLGFVRNFAYDQQQPFGLNKASDYVPGVPDNPAVAGGVSLTAIDNYTFIGSPDYLPKQQVPQQWQYVDNLSWNRGAHSLKAGIDMRLPMRNIYQDEASTRGTLEFSGQYTGNSYADTLTGYVRQGTLNNVYFVDQRLWMASGFVQDDWKLTPRITLNLGLRYEFAPPVTEAKNHQANFIAAGSGSLVYAKDGSLEDRTLVKVNTKNFAPRVGLAWSLNDKTVVRGGYGIYYLLLQRNGSENQVALNPPYLRQTTLVGTSTAPAFLLQNGFPTGLLDPANINLGLTRIRAVDPNSATPYVQQWSLGIQRMLPAGMVATVDYVGTKSTHLDIIHDLNQPITGAKPYPGFAYIEYQQALGNQSYNGLEASLQRRFHNGLSLNAAWTWSKSIQTTWTQTYFTRALSGFDVPQRFVASYVYELPFGKDKPFLGNGFGAALLGGWRTAGVYTFSSGLPFSVSSGSTYSNALDSYGATNALPNVIGIPTIVGTPSCWFYVSTNKSCVGSAPNASNAFALQQPGQIGNAGVNILRGPHSTVFDFSLMRDFRFHESANLQFRWEVFNLTNTAMFALPGATLSSGSVSTISSLAGDPRVMQFALRLSF